MDTIIRHAPLIAAAWAAAIGVIVAVHAGTPRRIDDETTPAAQPRRTRP